MNQQLATVSTNNSVSAAITEVSPIPKDVLIKLQQFQKQLDRKPTRVEKQDGFQHLPISQVEHLLKRYFFGLYQIQIINYQMIVNEITVHVRVSVFHPILAVWMHYDGIGAIPVMMNQGAKVAEFIQQKKTKALSLNLPAAYALAVKNAAKKIGKVFGGDLNRKIEDDYSEFIPQTNEPLNR